MTYYTFLSINTATVVVMPLCASAFCICPHTGWQELGSVPVSGVSGAGPLQSILVTISWSVIGTETPVCVQCKYKVVKELIILIPYRNLINKYRDNGTYLTVSMRVRVSQQCGVGVISCSLFQKPFVMRYFWGWEMNIQQLYVCIVVEVCSRCLETWRPDANIVLPKRPL